YAGLADAYCTVAGTFSPSNEALPKAKGLAEKALALDDTLAEGYAALGHAKVHLWDRSAEKDLQQALALNPNSVTALLWYAEYNQEFNPSAVIPTLEKAKRLDPIMSAVRGFLIFSYLQTRQFDLAFQEAKEAQELHPEDKMIHLNLF